jgi:SAM-dependent methyltransferase
VGLERQARYRWAAEVAGGGRVLDAACGAGWGTAVLAAKAAAAVGVDFSPAAVGDARREHGGLADFHEGDLRELPFGRGEFDSVVCFEAIAHVAEPERVLDELHRVLRAGGTLLISAPNRGAYPPGNPLHLSEIASAELERMLGERFANVAVHRQQTHFASLLCSTKTQAAADVDMPIDVQVRKVAGGPAGSELHAVAAASDDELPPAPAWLVLGEAADYEEQQRQLAEWRERAVRAEAEALALRKELRDRQG